MLLLIDALRRAHASPADRARGLGGLELSPDWLEAARARQAERLRAAQLPAPGVRLARALVVLCALGGVATAAATVFEAWRP